MAKIRIRSGDAISPLPTLAHVLERTLRALHPFMPFITEEIWQILVPGLPQEAGLPQAIMIAPYPQAHRARIDREAEEQISIVMQTIRAVRNARAQLHIPANQRLEALVETDGFRSTLEEEAPMIQALSRVDPLRILPQGGNKADGRRGVTLVVNPVVVHLPLEGVVDLGAEQQRLQTELDDCLKNMERVEKLVSNPNFREKAKPEVVQKEQERLEFLQQRRRHLDEILAQLAA